MFNKNNLFKTKEKLQKGLSDKLTNLTNRFKEKETLSSKIISGKLNDVLDIVSKNKMKDVENEETVFQKNQQSSTKLITNMKHYKNLLTLNIKEEHKNNRGKVAQKTPREHQRKSHDHMTSFFTQKDNSKKRGILVLPTGAGKTYTAVFWLLRNIVAQKKKVLWLADQGFLLEQARNEFKENILLVKPAERSEINILLVSGSSKHANTNKIHPTIDILLITSQTAISNWNKTYQKNDGSYSKTPFAKYVENAASQEDLFIVYDEAHHTPAYGRRNLLIGGSQGKIGICEKYPKTPLLGLTATPSYTDRKNRAWLWEIFEEKPIFEVSTKELEERDILAMPNYISEKTDFATLQLDDKELENIIIKNKEIPTRIIEHLAKSDARNEYLAQYYLKNQKKYEKTIIFLDRWYQCKKVEEYINKKAGKPIAASMFSYIDTNKNIDYINNRTNDQNDINLKKFKTGEIQVLLNVKMLTEGVDVPDVKTVFITRETNSKILFTQMVGRALRGRRAGGNKDIANIVFFVNNWNKHIQFASSKAIGEKQDEKANVSYKPLELINIELIKKLQFEYDKQDFNLSFTDMIPVGWYVVSYNDIFVEFNEINEKEETLETISQNILIFDNEKEKFEKFIENFKTKHKENIWEKDYLPEEHEEIIKKIIKTYFPEISETNYLAIKVKFMQIARHMGQDMNNEKPIFYTFEQKKDLDISKHVNYVSEKDYGRMKTEEYLRNVFYSETNPLFKIIFTKYEDFRMAYRYEEDVKWKSEQGKPNISEASQIIENRLMPHTERRERVLARDNNKCLCCGKTSNLQIDHIIAFKNQEPTDDNPELYQTLCSTCNKEKNANEFNFRITVYQKSKIKVRDVKLSSQSELKYPEIYLNRLINCYFGTNAVQKSFTKAVNNGNSIWRVRLIPSVLNLTENIREDKDKLIRIIITKGFKLSELEINII